MMAAPPVKYSGDKIVLHTDLRVRTTGGAVTVEKKKSTRPIKIGTWNVRSLNVGGKLENLKREMGRLNLAVLGIGEVKWRDDQDFWSGDYRIITTEAKNGVTGVGFVLNKALGKRVTYYDQISDRVILVKLDTKPVQTTIVQVYMPTSSADEDELERVYEEIEDAIRYVKGDENLIVMGDWNAIVGGHKEGNITGNHGIGERNERGYRLVEFCDKHSLVITNTLFKNHKRRIYTWTKPGGRDRFQLDYIMVKQRFRNQVLDCKAFPGADINSDHNLVAMTCRIKLKKLNKKKSARKWDLDKLKEVEISEQFGQAMGDSLENTAEGATVEEEWELLKTKIIRVGEEIVGVRKNRARKGWITEEILQLMDERRGFKNSQDVEGKNRYRVLRNSITKKCREAKENWLREKCKDIEQELVAGKIDSGYRKIREHFGDKKTKCIKLKDANGNLLLGQKERADRWKEYIEGLYWGEEMGQDIIEEEAMVDEDNIGDPILRSEFDRALKDLNSGKAVGIDEIPAELLRSIGESGLTRLFNLVKRIYETGEIPRDFEKSLIFTLPKKPKADKCENYRTISITSHALKIITRIIYRRIEPKVEDYLEDDQFGFRKSRGSREAILTLRLLLEGRIRKNKMTAMAFVDLEKAFDNVNWDVMFGILRRAGIKYRERKFILNLYKSQTAVIKIEDQEREAVIGKGVRQGCCLSSLLFNLYVEEATKIVKEKFRAGITVQGERIKMLRFADDLVLLAETPKDLEDMLNGLDRVYREEYGLKINKSKTKVMKSSREDDNVPMNVKIGGVQVDEISEFIYLGSKITRDGRSKVDIKSRLAQGRSAFYKKKSLLVSNIDLGIRKTFLQQYVWSTALYGSETWTLGKSERRNVDAFEMWCYRRMLKVKWTDRVTNDEVLTRMGAQRCLWNMLTNRRDRLVGHILRHESLTNTVLEGMVEGENCRGRQRMEYLPQIAEDVSCRNYAEVKRLAQDRTAWRLASNQSHD